MPIPAGLEHVAAVVNADLDAVERLDDAVPDVLKANVIV